MFFFMTTNKKQQCYPLCFFSWRPIKNNSLTPYVFFHDDQRKTTVLPPIFYLINIDRFTPNVYFMTADKKRQLPLMFFFLTTNKKQQCYPLCFLSWRPIKNSSLTPYVFFHDDQRKTSVTPYVLFDKYRQCYPFCFFHDDQ